MYRTYKRIIPEWLHNRPKKYIKHCLEKLDLSAEISTSEIQKHDMLTYSVKSTTYPNKFYEVFLGDDLIIPSCQCPEWKKKLLPCKHLLAVTNMLEDGWNCLSKKYRDSVFLNTDLEVIGVTTNKEESEKIPEENTKVNHHSNDQDDFGQNLENNVQEYCEIPKKSYPSRSMGSYCREKLQEIKSLTYLVTDEEAFDRLKTQLNVALEDLKESVTTDAGLHVRNSPKKSNKRKLSSTFEKLPRPKRKKSSLTGRVGVVSEARKAAQSIQVNVNCPKENRVTEEIAGIFVENDLSFSEMESSEESAEHVKKENKIVTFKENRDSRENKAISTVFPSVITAFQDVNLREIALKNGCFAVDYLNLMTLEVAHSRAQLKEIKKIDNNFKPGWLHDEIINSFLFNLSKVHNDVLICGSAQAMIIHLGKSFRKMWNTENLSQKSTILIPFNPTNNHWKLIYINLKEHSVSVLDPMVSKSQDEDSFNVAKAILQKKFGISKFDKLHFEYSLQRDSVNCGVFVCYFAEQIVLGKIFFSLLVVLFDCWFVKNINICCMKSNNGWYFPKKLFCDF